MIGRLCLAAVVAVVCSMLAVVPVGSVASAATGATLVEQVSPVGPSGHLEPGYRVARSYTGATCKSHSPETGDDYSCHVRFGYDPCWLSSKGHVVCLAAPYDRKLTRLRVARFVNAGGLGKPAAMPWGLMLANGVRTTLIAGDFGKVSGYEIHYSYDEFKTVLVGSIDKSGSVWRIRKARNVGRFRFKVVGWIDIKKAWFAAPTRLS